MIRLSKDYDRILQEAISVFGIERQQRKLSEECSELAAAINRVIDNPSPETYADFHKEMCDVGITLHSMALVFPIEETLKHVPLKMERLREKLDAAKALHPPVKINIARGSYSPPKNPIPLPPTAQPWTAEAPSEEGEYNMLVPIKVYSPYSDGSCLYAKLAKLNTNVEYLAGAKFQFQGPLKPGGEV